jgi:UDP-4-amino-4,6-dideoxy-N-acetyl-beta-L-altrosamine N-acetyltransferase
LHRLYPLETSHLEIILEWRNAPSVKENMYTQNIITLEQHRSWWEKTRRKADVQYFLYKNGDVPFGVVAFTEIDKHQGHASWAFYADPNAPKGTGSWMEVLALDFALIETGLNKLHCEVLSYNVGVINKHKKFGFKIEGVFVDQFKGDNGYADIVRLAIFASAWRKKRNEILENLKKY